MVARRSDYSVEAVEAAHSVLLELSRLLGEYQDSVVVVGGWVPDLLLSDPPRQHVGSIDVDIVLDHTKTERSGIQNDFESSAGAWLPARGAAVYLLPHSAVG